MPPHPGSDCTPQLVAGAHRHSRGRDRSVGNAAGHPWAQRLLSEQSNMRNILLVAVLLIAVLFAASPASANPGCDAQWNNCQMGVEDRYRECLSHPIYGWFPEWFCEPELEQGKDTCDSDYLSCMYCESREGFDC